MAEDDGIAGFLRTTIRRAGKQSAQARREYRAAKRALPTDDEGRARLVCRRHADERAVPLDADGRPACFQADHPDCEGCLEDVRDGRIDTW